MYPNAMPSFGGDTWNTPFQLPQQAAPQAGAYSQPSYMNQPQPQNQFQMGYENLSAMPMQYNIRPQQQAYSPSYGMPQNMVGMNNTPFVPRGLSGLTHYRGLF